MQKEVQNLKIAYIGGGSRGWAWNLMSDLAIEPDLCGDVYLYDIDLEAAQYNETIGNHIKDSYPSASDWKYHAVPTLKEALAEADFVIISILPGTFDEMESDVHAPEAYGLYQSVGDTIGPGGVIRALRTIPMYEVIASAIRDFCPDAWVINYTNPMAVCCRTLYRVFPKIKAFGCCHEVFGTQKLLASAVKEIRGQDEVERSDIKINVLGVNHFTWITKAYYKEIDLFPLYRQYVEKYGRQGIGNIDENNFNKHFKTRNFVKFDLFRRYGLIAAAGDRHLAEFCPPNWYLKDPHCVESWGFKLTTVKWRREQLAERLEKSRKMFTGELPFEIKPSGEEGVKQIKAILGMGDLTTNVNMPNYGQIPNLPLGAVVETNARFTAGQVTPVFAGEIPAEICPLVIPVAYEQEMTVEAGLTRNLSLAYKAFVSDAQMQISLAESRALFDTMVANTKEYLTDYR